MKECIVCEKLFEYDNLIIFKDKTICMGCENGLFIKKTKDIKQFFNNFYKNLNLSKIKNNDSFNTKKIEECEIKKNISIFISNNFKTAGPLKYRLIEMTKNDLDINMFVEDGCIDFIKLFTEVFRGSRYNTSSEINQFIKFNNKRLINERLIIPELSEQIINLLNKPKNL